MYRIIVLIAITYGNCAFAQINWTINNSVATSGYGNLHPRITMDLNGNPLLIWGRMFDNSVFFTRWNGTSFTSPVKLNGSINIATASWMGPDIASHGDTIYVVMKETPESDSTRHIYIVRSFDGGQMFSTPTRVDFISDSLSRFPTVTTDAIGNPIVAFMKFDSNFGDSRWVVTKSNDYGSTFSVDTKASGWGSSAQVCDCCPGSILTSGPNCTMLYRNNNNNVRDSWAGFSSNNGNNFTSGCNIDNNNWMVMACPASGPDGAIIDDTLFSVFSSRASGSYRNYISKTTLSNATWMNTQNLTGAVSGLTMQNYPRIASFGNVLGIVWKQIINGADQLPLLFTNDIASGLPTAYDTVAQGDITNADVAIGNGKIVVCWQDDVLGTVRIRFGTFSPNTTEVAELIPSHSFSLFPNPTTSEVTLQSDQTFSNANIEVVDLKGETVKQISNYSGKSIVIKRDLLPNGIYFIKVAAENKEMQVAKFVLIE